VRPEVVKGCGGLMEINHISDGFADLHTGKSDETLFILVPWHLQF
jgi:hypothetical protein